MGELNLQGLALHLVNDGLLSKDHALQLLIDAERSKQPLIRYLIKNNCINSHQLAISAATYFGLEHVDLSTYDCKQLETFNISSSWVRHYRILPLEKTHQTLKIGLSDPTQLAAVDAVKLQTGCRIIPVMVSEEQLNKIIQQLFYDHANHLAKSPHHDLNAPPEQHRIIQEDEPLIHYVNQTIEHAINEHASDIHIEPYQRYCRIRYRRDGLLYEIAQIQLELATRFILRLKIMAKLDITEQRMPQDGRFQLGHIDIRINTCPTLHGEKAVLRLLGQQHIALTMEALGFNLAQQQLFMNYITKPHGMILATGPTGSGKTTTLYAALHYLNTTERNISTAEDPIEIQCHGINQVAISPKIGLNYAGVLRTFLRQDPDVIMVGEIRDPETAAIAIQAAETGHLVLSTLHTNSAIETLYRLQSMNIEPYKIASSLSLIIAQRLLRKLCIHCKQPEPNTDKILNNCGITASHSITLYRATGCKQCLNGYHGRIAIYEMMAITTELSNALFNHRGFSGIHECIQLSDFQTLHQSGIEKVIDGTTSLTELNRVLFT